MADQSPPPYIAALLQEFQVNHQFNENLVAHLERNTAQHQSSPISLQDFVRLNPVTFSNSSDPLDADDWLRDIAFQMESYNVAPASYVNFATHHLRGSAAQW